MNSTEVMKLRKAYRASKMNSIHYGALLAVDVLNKLEEGKRVSKERLLDRVTAFDKARAREQRSWERLEEALLSKN